LSQVDRDGEGRKTFPVLLFAANWRIWSSGTCRRVAEDHDNLPGVIIGQALDDGQVDLNLLEN
jgi:hypothetical protein